MQSGVGGDLLELYTGPKTDQKPFVYYKSLVEYQQSLSQHFEIFKKKAGPSDPAFHRNFILCIALCYGCIPFIASIASSAEIMGLTLNLT